MSWDSFSFVSLLPWKKSIGLTLRQLFCHHSTHNIILHRSTLFINIDFFMGLGLHVYVLKFDQFTEPTIIT